ncbi:cytochrome P450 [Mycena rosella]|uniref:Cytochrome P450 n=1 Tax=Mycena rosella TaxID=1033263 RepID=A0AAD7CTV2_MYCRO|nr:cytochrome P450 [Mycena rosella]
MPSTATVILAPIAGVLSPVVVQRLFRAQLGALPPGPTGLPILGNVFDMPGVTEWLTFAEWGAKWGGICSVTLLGQPIVILNSAPVMEKMDTKGSVFSTRPRLPMAGELLGYDQTLVLMPASYGARFRTFRKYFAKLIGTPGVMRKFVPLVEAETHRFLKRVLLNPNAGSINAYLRKLTGGIILGITYGIEVQEEDDPFVALVEDANENFSAATAPGAFLVDLFPALMYSPEFLAPFKQTARVWALATKTMVEAPYMFVRRQMADGTAPVSFVSSLLENGEKLTEEDLRDIKDTAGSLYGGGADTTSSSLYAFFLAMVLTPEVQLKAQAEIDSVTGGTRLPSYSDRDQLPYVSAVVTELMRWHSIAPLGVPHAALEDTVVHGYLIPKGSIIIANLWSACGSPQSVSPLTCLTPRNMLHDPETYPVPETFDPERHLARPAQRDPRTFCFGFGRRVCPGQEFAETSLFVFAKPFDCVVRPRSEKAATLVSGEL